MDFSEVVIPKFLPAGLKGRSKRISPPHLIPLFIFFGIFRKKLKFEWGEKIKNFVAKRGKGEKRGKERENVENS